jgi:hypothetical protein
MGDQNSNVYCLSETEIEILQLAKPYLKVRDNEIHTENAIEFALRILRTHTAERAIVVPSLILHDVGWSEMTKEAISRTCRPDAEKLLARPHEMESVKIAANILKDVRYEPAKTLEILEIINGHDTRTAALSINDEIVKDSDKLTRYARNFWFWTGQIPMAPGELADALEHNIDQWFFLEASKKMARAELTQRRIEIAREA